MKRYIAVSYNTQLLPPMPIAVDMDGRLNKKIPIYSMVFANILHTMSIKSHDMS